MVSERKDDWCREADWRKQSRCKGLFFHEFCYNSESIIFVIYHIINGAVFR
jgi:hypothetical protein